MATSPKGKAASLYAELEAMSEKALASGDAALHHTLHPVVVSLAGAKYSAHTALSSVDGEAAELLAQIKAL
jgi:hypothetical protein